MESIGSSAHAKKASAYFCWTSENSRQLWLTASAANTKQTGAEGCLQVPVDHKDLIQLGRAALNVSHLAHIFPFAQLASVARRNERERKRVRQINSAFSSLRQHVQHRSAKRKLSKAETLRCAIDYINYLRKVLDKESPPKGSKDEEIDIVEGEEDSNSTIPSDSSGQIEDEKFPDFREECGNVSKYYSMSPNAPPANLNELYNPQHSYRPNADSFYPNDLFAREIQSENCIEQNYRVRRSAFQLHGQPCVSNINY